MLRRRSTEQLQVGTGYSTCSTPQLQYRLPSRRSKERRHPDCLLAAQRWWDQQMWAAVCPHGLVSPNLSFDGMCACPSCLDCATAHCDAAVFSIHELPRIDDPIRWPREWRTCWSTSA